MKLRMNLCKAEEERLFFYKNKNDSNFVLIECFGNNKCKELEHILLSITEYTEILNIAEDL